MAPWRYGALNGSTTTLTPSSAARGRPRPPGCRSRARTGSPSSRRPGSRRGAPRVAVGLLRHQLADLRRGGRRDVSRVSGALGDLHGLIVAERGPAEQRERARLCNTGFADGQAVSARSCIFVPGARSRSQSRRRDPYALGLASVPDLCRLRGGHPRHDDRPARSSSRRARRADEAADDAVRVGRLRRGRRAQDRRFTVSFYLTAMLFILFDIEIVFLYPLAVQLNALGWFGLVRVPLVRRDPRSSPTSTSGARERSSGISPKLPGDQRPPAREGGPQLRARADAEQGPGRLRAGGRGDRGRAGAHDGREGRRLGAVELDVARHLRARVLRDRDDVDRLVALRHRPVRHGAIQLVAPPGRPPDRLRARDATRWPPRCARCTTRCSSRSG